MDHLAKVTRLTNELNEAERAYKAARQARNEAIKFARSERYGPTAIGRAAGLTTEQVRRICNS